MHLSVLSESSKFLSNIGYDSGLSTDQYLFRVGNIFGRDDYCTSSALLLTSYFSFLIQ